MTVPDSRGERGGGMRKGVSFKAVLGSDRLHLYCAVWSDRSWMRELRLDGGGKDRSFLKGPSE